MPSTLRQPAALPEPSAAGWPPSARALLLHALCTPLAWMLTGGDGTYWWLAAESLLAAGGGLLLGLAPWWLPINLLFAPVLALALAADPHPGWAFGAFALMFLCYRGVGRTQVPLFFSADAAVGALLGLLPETPRPRLIDLGCGNGKVIAKLAAARGDGSFHGIEYAPLPWLAAWLRCLPRGRRCSLRWGDFWAEDLSGYDLAYAYLSPVPMVRLWRKALAEMRPGTLLVSNSFAVPGVVPEAIIELEESWAGRLYVYRIPGKSGEQ